MTETPPGDKYRGLSVTIATSDLQREMGSEIREQVFIHEQGVPPQEEHDGQDRTATHYLALLDGVPIGAARARKLGISNRSVNT